MYQNIPFELQGVPHWVVWRYEEANGRKTKVPYSVKGFHASVNNPKSWATFYDALDVVENYDGLGFVLTKDDPYAFIDLDHTELPDEIEKQREIWAQFGDTYSELSPSGKGLHIIARARIPQGRKRSWLEMYSDNRFMTMTGNVYNRQQIVDCQNRFMNIYNQIGEREIVLDFTETDEQYYSDEEVLERMFNAVNGDKARDLYNGDYQGYYSSQSEADLALVNIISFYSRFRDQIKRLFHQSALGMREKAYRPDYIDKIITKSFDNLPPELNITNLAKNTQDAARNFTEQGLELDLTEEIKILYSDLNIKSITGMYDQNIPITDTDANYSIDLDIDFPDLPDGLIKEIAKFVYQQSPRPIKEIAQVTALAFMSGICGRSYNISGTGLNAYYILLAMSGLGKETMQKGVEKLIDAVMKTQPNADKFVGLSELVSGQGLLRYFVDKSSCFLTIQGEFANLMRRMTATNAPSHMIVLKKMLLDLYNKSGYGNKLQGVAYSDVKNNIGTILSPSFTLLGESVPDAFYQTLSESLAEEGLISRLLIYEAPPTRPLMNYNHSKVKVPEKLRNALQILITNCLTLNSLNNVMNVDMDDDVVSQLHLYDIETNEVINKTTDDVKRQLITRNHLKIMKMAALFAIGDNFYKPKISMLHYEYAKKLVDKSTNGIIHKYEAEEIGDTVGNQNKQLQELQCVIGDIILNMKSQTSISDAMRRDYVIPRKLISDKAKATRHYRMSRHPTKSQSQLITEHIYALVEEGRLVEIPARDVMANYNSTGKAYSIGDPEHFIRCYKRYKQ